MLEDLLEPHEKKHQVLKVSNMHSRTLQDPCGAFKTEAITSCTTCHTNRPQHASTDPLDGKLNSIVCHTTCYVAADSSMEDGLSCRRNELYHACEHRCNILPHIKLNTSRKPHGHKICMSVATMHHHEPIFGKDGALRAQDVFSRRATTHKTLTQVQLLENSPTK